MFQFLYMFGPAVLTYFVVNKCMNKAADNWYTALLEVIAYAMVDTAVMVLFLLSSGKVELIILTNGMKVLQYGGTAFLLSLPVSVVLGILIAAIRKGVDIKVTSEKKQTKKD